MEISTAARLIKMGLFVDGQKVGVTPAGNPIWCKHKAMVVHMQPAKIEK
jgi:hypothetical protein